MECLLCGTTINWQPTLWNLICFKKLAPPRVCARCSQAPQKLQCRPVSGMVGKEKTRVKIVNVGNKTRMDNS